jgi:hypothetical protein
MAVAACLALIALSTDARAQENVGVSSAVNPQASGTPPGGTTRQLVIGQDVVFNERITTSAAGQTQLLFLDESAMTIGPNSDVTIDQFVYDPKSGTGKLAMSATRGVLRYVGGKLSKQDQAVTVRTNTATLAVRGGAFIMTTEPARTEAIFIYGDGLTVNGVNNVPQTLRRPGFEIVAAAGAALSQPIPVPAARLTQLVQLLDGRAGATGGARNVPTDATVAQSGISQTISGNLGESVQQALANRFGAEAFRTDRVDPVTLTNNVVSQPNTICANASCTEISSASGNAPSPPAPVTVTYAGGTRYTNGNGTSRGFADPNGTTVYNSGQLSFTSGSPQSGVFTGNAGGAVGTISFPLVPGTASFQGSSTGLGALTGTSFLSADSTFFYATITPTGQPNERLFIYGGIPAGSTAFAQTGSTRLFAFTVQPDAALQSQMPFVRSQAGGNLPTASVSPLYVAAPPTTPIGSATTAAAARGLQTSLAITGQGPNQQASIAVTTGTFASQQNGQPIFVGQMRGSSMLSSSGTPVRLGSAVSSAVDGNGNSIYGGNSISGFVLDQTAFNATGGVVGTPISQSTASEIPLSGSPTTYGFAQAVVPTPVPSGVGASRTTQAQSGYFGGLMYTSAQSNPYIATGGALVSTDAPNNRVQATLAGSAQSPSSGVSTMTMQFGGLTGDAAGRQSFIDDSTFAALESQVAPQQINGQNLVVNGSTSQAGQLYLVSSGAAGTPTSLLPSGTLCQCQYLQWGYWGGDLMTGSASDSTISRIDRGNINTWVAGVPTPLNELGSLISQSATASYTGNAIGSVFNNGLSYIAAGGFTGTYNFGTQSGVLSINNFDGRTFTVAGSAPLTGANYTFSGSASGFAGTANGTFYGPNATETGGNFAFQSTVGPTYLASGIYAGKRQ